MKDLTTENTEGTERATPETDSQITTFDSISKYKKRFKNKTGTVSANFARKLERERDEARALVDRLHVAFEGRCRATYEWYSTQASDVREAALKFLHPEQ